jgi:DNA-binding response OmpR family regulator
VKKILIIEDEAILAEMYVDKFKKAGYHVFLAKDAEMGFAVAKQEKPDLVVLDILLPKGNGISFLKELRSDSRTANIGVVAFSNFDDPPTKKEAISLGVKDYLIKTNYTPQALIEKIDAYIWDNK